MRDDLINTLKELDIIHRGNVNLKNAGASQFYIDIKKAYGYPAALNLICDKLWQIIEKDATCIATTGYGGMAPAATISARYNRHLTLVRDEPKKHGMSGLIDGYLPTEKDKVAIIDDVFTTGKSIKKTIEILKPTGAEIIGCYVVCKRGEGKLETPLHYLLTSENLGI